MQSVESDPDWQDGDDSDGRIGSSGAAATEGPRVVGASHEFKEFLCDACGKAFHKSSRLARHMLSHTREVRLGCCLALASTRVELCGVHDHVSSVPVQCNLADGPSFSSAVPRVVRALRQAMYSLMNELFGRGVCLVPFVVTEALPVPRTRV